MTSSILRRPNKKESKKVEAISSVAQKHAKVAKTEGAEMEFEGNEYEEGDEESVEFFWMKRVSSK